MNRKLKHIVTFTSTTQDMYQTLPREQRSQQTNIRKKLSNNCIKYTRRKPTDTRIETANSGIQVKILIQVVKKKIQVSDIFNSIDIITEKVKVDLKFDVKLSLGRLILWQVAVILVMTSSTLLQKATRTWRELRSENMNSS